VLSEHGVTIVPATFYKWLTCPITPAQLEEAYLVNELVDLYRRNKCVPARVPQLPGSAAVVR